MTLRYSKIEQLAHARLRRGEEARTLLKNAHFHGAVYLKGYELECVLKVCLMRLTGTGSLEDLSGALGLRQPQFNRRLHDLSFFWEHVKRRSRLSPAEVNTLHDALLRCGCWSVEMRYSPSRGNRHDAEAFFRHADRIIDKLG